MTTKATLYLDEEIFRALKMRAVLSDQTMSETANDLLGRGLAPEKGRPASASKVELRLEGKGGYPVLQFTTWPDAGIFDREDVYD